MESGGKLTGVVAPLSDNHKKTCELLDELCVFYMSIGVSYQDYWHGDTVELAFRARAWLMQQDREFEQRNQQAYLAGLYNYNAFSSVIARFAWGLNGKKGQEPEGYLDAPLAFTENEKKQEEEREKAKAIKWFLAGQKNGR